MTIEETDQYNRQFFKLLKKRKLTKEQIDKTLQAFLKDPHDQRVQYKIIHCKKDKRRHSMRVISTGYRILVSDFISDENLIKLRYILDHDEYQRINRNC